MTSEVSVVRKVLCAVYGIFLEGSDLRLYVLRKSHAICSGEYYIIYMWLLVWPWGLVKMRPLVMECQICPS